MEIVQTLLPGVGVKYEMTTKQKVPVSIVVHRDGSCDLTVASREDPDEMLVAVSLDEHERDAMSDVLGARRFSEREADLTKAIPGLESSRITIEPGSPFANGRLADTRARTRTGCSIVAIVRPNDIITAPQPSQSLEAGDVLVAIGADDGLDALARILRNG